MIFNKQTLLSELLDRTHLLGINARPFLRLHNKQLNQKPAKDKWSIAEIFEHLNVTHQVYIDSIVPEINRAADTNQCPEFRSTWLGDWFYERNMPRPDGTIQKIKTPKSINTHEAALDGHDVVNRFLQHQDSIHDIIQHASTKDIEAIKIPFAFTSLLKLRLGDNLRFLVAHNERHLMHAQRIMAEFQ